MASSSSSSASSNGAPTNGGGAMMTLSGVTSTPTTLVMAASSGAGGAATTTVLSSAQATQLLQRLQHSQGGVGGVLGGAGGHTIKIQAVQTHPQTGVRQIIAIPIHTTSAPAATHATPESTTLYASGGHANPGKLTISPMKAKMSGLGFGPNVKVVKIASSANLSGLSLVQSTPTQVSAPTSIITSHGSRDNSGLSNIVSYGTPGSGIMPGTAETPGSASRKRNDIDFDAFSDAKRKKTEKGGKGLRHFSMKVCEKVQAKGTTSYNEVADELVAELTDPRCTSPTDQQYDQKNIRRRVYDALNVLMAMNIISKEKKEIRWLGLPTNSVQEANNLEADKLKRMERIKAKTQQLQDLILQTIAFKNLVERNREREKQDGQPAPNSAIQLPFIIVNTNKKTVIDCSISNDKMEYLFNFDDTFEIHDDMEVLKRMGLGFGLERGEVTPENLAKARQMMPRALEQYVTQLAENGPGSCVGMPNVSDPVTLTYKNGDSKTPKIDSKSSIMMSTQNQFANVSDFEDVEVN